MTADPAAVPGGTQLSGMLVASIDGTAVAAPRSASIAEPERYDLTITATGFDGEPVDTYGMLYQVETGIFEPFGVAGEITMRLPAGRYSVMSYMDVDVEADRRSTALVGDPDLVLDGPAEVAFDARATKPVDGRRRQGRPRSGLQQDVVPRRRVHGQHLGRCGPTASTRSR